MSIERLLASIRTGRTDDYLLKVVVPSQRFIWLWIPKNAGGSISRTLLQVYGEDAIPTDLPFERLWRLNPELKTFRIVALKRNPFRRAVSCWLNKIADRRGFTPSYLHRYPGLRAGMSFPEFAEWLNTSEGSDEVADPHWQSQYLQLERVTEMLRFEDLPDVVTSLGIPPAELPRQNPYWRMAAAAGLDKRPLLEWYDQGTIELIRRRYDRDFELLKYGMPKRLQERFGLIGPGAAPADSVRPPWPEGDGQGWAGEPAGEGVVANVETAGIGAEGRQDHAFAVGDEAAPAH